MTKLIIKTPKTHKTPKSKTPKTPKSKTPKSKNTKSELINIETIKEWTNNFKSNPLNQIIQNIISMNSLYSICINRNAHQQCEIAFERRITPVCDILDQKNSGTCWIFSGLNVIRPLMANYYLLNKDFEFSKSYLYLYDRLERINNFFDKFNDNIKNNNTNKNIITYKMMSSLIEEGGYMTNFKYLINKYGLLPNSVFIESEHTQSTTELDHIINTMCNSYCLRILNGTSIDQKLMMEEFYHVLIKFIGTPPETFNWDYYDSTDDEKYHCHNDLTALSFYNDYVKKVFKVDNYIEICNNPCYEYNKTLIYSIHKKSYYDNEKSLNLPMTRIFELIITMINANIPVSFGCDMNNNYTPYMSLIDNESFNIENIVGISHHNTTKNDRIKWENMLRMHAMTFTGYKCYPDKIIFECANSWGTGEFAFEGKGYLHLSSHWLIEHLYGITIHKKYLTCKELSYYNTEPIIIKEIL